MNPDLPGASRKGASPSPPVGERATLPGRVSARPGLFQIPPEITRGENAAPESPVGSVGGVMQPRPIIWTPDKIALLTELWAKGMTTLKIAERLGVSKNAAIGMVHRLGLKKRPSPLYAGKTPGPSAAEIIAEGQEWRGCLYMFGDPDDSDWRFCQNPREGNPSYCPVHHAKTRQKPGQVGAAFKLPNLTTLDK